MADAKLIETLPGNGTAPPRFGAATGAISNYVRYAIYGLALAVSISTWFIAIQAPLGLDETGSYWQISAGFSKIWHRQSSALEFPAYSYILWLTTKLIGNSEVALRIPSIIAMVAATYLLYLAAKELFEFDLAIIATVIFCLHPVILYASIDIRPYAFAALATNAAIYILLRLRNSDSNLLAVMFGLAAASIVWFHYLFIDILPALVLCFFVVKNFGQKTTWRQFGFAFTAFAVAFLPVIPAYLRLLRTSKTHIYELAPKISDLAWTFMPGRFFFVLCGTAFIAFLVNALSQRPCASNRLEGRRIFLGASLAFIPILTLYGISVGTSIHTFATRHRLDAIPGIAICWALFLNLFYSRNVRLLFCATLVAVSALQIFNSPFSKLRQPTLKYALDAAERNVEIDNAPVLMCSGFVESNYVTMPSAESVKDSAIFAPISYYGFNGTVIPLPQRINEQTLRIGSSFLKDAVKKHHRFIVVGNYVDCYETFEWFTQNAFATHTVHQIGVFDGTEVLEFVPRTYSTP
jgi:hypothetical protein